ncbi:MAG: HU family DNA-binding protein [Bacteroidetes bacterium]|nr:HU family DNA-binding protein [Bacteroidota bacterium]
MNRTELISGVSITCGLSRQESELIINSMLRNISESIFSGDIVKLKSFGEFQLRSVMPDGSDCQWISFKSSGNLDSKMNKLYEFLSPERRVYDRNKLEQIYKKSGLKDFDSGDYTDSEVNNDIPEKRLISDKLIDLHNEIVKNEKIPPKKNLWG